jgi:hypothetical protein
MMDPSETHNFNDQWKKAFQNASETPPPSVWEGIEARLDQDENNVTPLWWRTPKMWYAAASIIALLVVGGGFWLNNKNSGTFSGKNSVEMAVKQQEVKESGKVAELPDSQSSGADKSEQLIAKSAGKGEKSSDQTEDVVAFGREKKNPSIIAQKTDAKKNNVELDRVLAKVKSAKDSDIFSDSKEIKEENVAPSASISNAKENAFATNLKPQEAIAAVTNEAIEIAELTPMPYNELAVYMQKRYVYFKPENAQEEKLPQLKKQNEYWAGVGIMPATFNPDVQLKVAPASFNSLQSMSSQSATRGTNKAGNSIALQTQGGMRISKHWSLEMGVSYLKGNSKYEGGGYLLDVASARRTNVLEDALVGFSNGKNHVPNSPVQGGNTEYNSADKNAFYIDVNKNIGNNYQYLQLPLQAGFTLNPDKKLSYSLLGGMMANFFLSNELESASGKIIKTTASDEVYRNLNWAATTGVRFNYKVSTRWKATLMGSYQRAVSSGFKANQSMESHPYLYGVSWGMRYSF